MLVLFTDGFSPILGWALLVEAYAASPRTQHPPVIQGGRCRVFMSDVITLILILLKEVKEAFIAANLYDAHLKCIPTFCKYLLNVALMVGIGLLVNQSAVRA